MIEIKDITKAYKKQRVLKGINLTCKKGKIQALLGANGSGKSTLINIISGLIKMDEGTFFINHKKITINNYKYRLKVGYVFEKPIYIDKLSANEYLIFVAKLYGLQYDDYSKRIKELLAFFELPTLNKKYIEDYSKGMKSKVSLAAALLNQPTYLILDEPFDGFDFITIQKISRLFQQMASKGATILIASHQFDIVANLCDNFALLKDGSIAFNLTMPKLIEKAEKEYPTTENSVKIYLESLMNGTNKTTLSWL